MYTSIYVSTSVYEDFGVLGTHAIDVEIDGHEVEIDDEEIRDYLQDNSDVTDSWCYRGMSGAIASWLENNDSDDIHGFWSNVLGNTGIRAVVEAWLDANPNDANDANDANTPAPVLDYILDLPWVENPPAMPARLEGVIPRHLGRVYVSDYGGCRALDGYPALMPSVFRGNSYEVHGSLSIGPVEAEYLDAPIPNEDNTVRFSGDVPTSVRKNAYAEAQAVQRRYGLDAGLSDIVVIRTHVTLADMGVGPVPCVIAIDRAASAVVWFLVAMRDQNGHA